MCRCIPHQPVGERQPELRSLKFLIYTMGGSLDSCLQSDARRSFRDLRPAHVISTLELARAGSLLLGMSVSIVKSIAFWAFAIAFAIKVPVWPFHTWLPDAHTEAPTAGSMILAGVLLKLGAYGFLRLILPSIPLRQDLRRRPGPPCNRCNCLRCIGRLWSNGLQTTRRIFLRQSYGLCSPWYSGSRPCSRNGRCNYRIERSHPSDVQSWFIGGGHVLPGRRDL